MSRSLWNIRLRHVWLMTPLKGKRQRRRSRERLGLQAALDRKAPDPSQESGED